MERGRKLQVNGVGAPQGGQANCAALCPSVKDIVCQLRNRCWKSLVSLSAGLIGLLAGGLGTLLHASNFTILIQTRQVHIHGPWGLHALQRKLRDSTHGLMRHDKAQSSGSEVQNYRDAVRVQASCYGWVSHMVGG